MAPVFPALGGFKGVWAIGFLVGLIYRCDVGLGTCVSVVTSESQGWEIGGEAVSG